MNTWECKNHGGQPMKSEVTKPKALVIGRFQPYHHGHTSLVEQKLSQGVPVVVMVRDMPADEKNPFTTEQTVAMIRKFHEAKKHDVQVMIIPDIESVNYGRGVGYEINEWVPVSEISFISATKIRESIKTNNNEWREMVDASIQQDVIDNLISNDLLISK